MTRLLRIACLLLCVGMAEHVRAAEVMPPAPKRYFNDYAGVVPAAEVRRMNGVLEQFEKETSNQVVVAVFPRMQSDSSIEDYTVRVFHSWKVGQKGKNNGAVLFVFVQEHKLYLQVGYGLEGALPDALCKRIINREIVPQFKAGQFAKGLDAGIHAIMAATKGEYKGTGKTVRENEPLSAIETSIPPVLFVLFIIAIILVFVWINKLSRSTTYGRSGRRRYYGGSWNDTPGGFWWGGGGSNDSGGGGGWSGGDSGGFSGGGGDSGGGGAGGSW